MDWGTVWVGVSTFVAGGVLGSAATVYTTRKESRDRRQALDLEREKWEHERDQPLRERRREALRRALDALSRIGEYLYDAYNKNPKRLNAMMGDFHEARVVSGSLHSTQSDLLHNDLEAEAELLEVV